MPLKYSSAALMKASAPFPETIKTQLSNLSQKRLSGLRLAWHFHQICWFSCIFWWPEASWIRIERCWTLWGIISYQARNAITPTCVIYMRSHSFKPAAFVIISLVVPGSIKQHVQSQTPFVTSWPLQPPQISFLIYLFERTQMNYFIPPFPSTRTPLSPIHNGSIQCQG